MVTRILLSICETLRLRNASFFRFLLSGDTDIDKFLEMKTNRLAWQYINPDVYNKYETEVCLYNLVFYTTERGDSPVDDFLDGLDKKSRAKVAAHLTLLEEQGLISSGLMLMSSERKSGSWGYTRVRISTVSSISFSCVTGLFWCTHFWKRRSSWRRGI